MAMMLPSLASAALRGLGAGRATWAGVVVRCREFSGTACAAHVQPVQEDAPEAGQVSAAEKPRWQRELGAVRTDWT